MPDPVMLKPGVLVLPTVGIRGGSHGSFRVVDSMRVGPGRLDTTEGTRRIAHVEQRKAARALMMTLHRGIESIGAPISGGVYFVPRDRQDALDAWIAGGRGEVAAHNAGIPDAWPDAADDPTLVYCDPRVIAIAGDDEWSARQAAAALSEATRDLETAMSAPIPSPDAIREAAGKAARLVPLLQDADSALLQDAVDAARTVARTVKREVEKKGRAVAEVLAELDAAPVSAARFRFAGGPESAPAADSEIAPVGIGRFGRMPDSARPAWDAAAAATAAFVAGTATPEVVDAAIRNAAEQEQAAVRAAANRLAGGGASGGSSDGGDGGGDEPASMAAAGESA